ncbi:zinc finger protein 558-like [Armigeres subalbatus]|uniref:zinc finger protein 558-like n=1 Tax=Armigeres subalbatus TaxID=124917 RepID=UPI002ED3353E
MLSDWRTWCRLCAHEYASFELESLDELNEIMKRHFHFTIQDLDKVSSCICEGCYNFINKLDDFEVRCFQTSKMLFELCVASTTCDNLLESFIQDSRSRFLSQPFVASKDDNVCLNLNTDRAKQQETTMTRISSDVQHESLEPETIEDLQEDLETTFEIDDSRVMQAEHTMEPTSKPEGDNLVIFDEMSSSKREEQTTRETITLSNETSKKGYKPTLNDVPQSDLYDDQDVDYNALNELESESETEAEETCETGRNNSAKNNETMPTSGREVEMPSLANLPSDQKLDYSCGYCDKKFSELRLVQAHFKEIHIGERPYSCKDCNQSYATEQSLEEHRATHLNEELYQCSYCPRKVKYLFRLKLHESVHKEALHICPHCGVQLKTKRTLRSHMLTHSVDKMFKCPHCDCEYKRSVSLRTHIVKHPGVKLFKCTFCEKEFVFTFQRRAHEKILHPKEFALLEASKGESG